MGFIDDEVSEVSQLCESVIPKSTLITCLVSLVRVEIQQTTSRHLTICIRFPQNYPSEKLLLEFKSKTMSDLFLERFNQICDTKLADFVGNTQVIKILIFISDYLADNPLCIVLNELQNIRLRLSNSGELKLKQKTSSVNLYTRGGQYFYKATFTVPQNYPAERILWDACKSNLPYTLLLFVDGQAKEIARQCVEAPLRKQTANESFEVKPSLQRTLEFIIAAILDFPSEKCPICAKCCLPTNPSEIFTTADSDELVVRMFCGHIYHQGCLKRFMSEPPFPPGGKTCPAPKKHPRSDRRAREFGRYEQIRSPVFNATCGQRVAHDKWGLNDVKSAEAKWAHQQARIRELEEVIDFLQ
uniref:RING-type domain-containing protein n=1 Tax=Anopheles atroparvus TaxID=41427 RepID=A0AAG5D2W0_ANOAO